MYESSSAAHVSSICICKKSPQVPQKYSQPSKLVLSSMPHRGRRRNESRLSPQIPQKPTGLCTRRRWWNHHCRRRQKAQLCHLHHASREKQSDEPTDYQVPKPPAFICALLPKSVAQSPLNLKKPNVDCNRNRKYPQPDLYIKPLSDRALLVEGDLGASRLGAVDSAKVTATTTAETTAATTTTTTASTGTSTATTEAATTAASTALRTRA